MLIDLNTIKTRSSFSLNLIGNQWMVLNNDLMVESLIYIIQQHDNSDDNVLISYNYIRVSGGTYNWDVSLLWAIGHYR